MTKTTKFHPVKHIPQRTCVACRQVKAKRELIRLVRVADGTVEVDTGGKKEGRGAYLCPEPECWTLGLQRGRIERTLRTTLDHDNRQRLIKAAVELGFTVAV